jgi:hypothetical protein
VEHQRGCRDSRVVSRECLPAGLVAGEIAKEFEKSVEHAGKEPVGLSIVAEKLPYEAGGSGEHLERFSAEWNLAA